MAQSVRPGRFGHSGKPDDTPSEVKALFARAGRIAGSYKPTIAS